MNLDKIIPLFINKVKVLLILIPYFCENILIYSVKYGQRRIVYKLMTLKLN